MAQNKVVFGLKNVHYAIITGTTESTGRPTYSTPKAVRGAVNLSLSPDGDTNDFYADNIKYYTTVTNQGYSGDLEIARIPDEMLVEVFGFTKGSTSKVLTEDSSVEPKEFALLFQIDGDDDDELHVLYRCTATRPEINGATATESKEPQTATISLTVAATADGLVRARTTSETPSSTKSGWFTSVYFEA